MSSRLKDANQSIVALLMHFCGNPVMFLKPTTAEEEKSPIWQALQHLSAEGLVANCGETWLLVHQPRTLDEQP